MSHSRTISAVRSEALDGPRRNRSATLLTAAKRKKAAATEGGPLSRCRSSFRWTKRMREPTRFSMAGRLFQPVPAPPFWRVPAPGHVRDAIAHGPACAPWGGRARRRHPRRSRRRPISQANQRDPVALMSTRHPAADASQIFAEKFFFIFLRAPVARNSDTFLPQRFRDGHHEPRAVTNSADR